MSYSLLVKTWDEVPCCLVTFNYYAPTSTFENVVVTNFSDDVLFRVNPEQCPPRGVLHIQADNIFEVPRRYDAVSDFRIMIVGVRMRCQQCDEYLDLYWNPQMVENNGEYVLVPYEDEREEELGN